MATNFSPVVRQHSALRVSVIIKRRRVTPYCSSDGHLLDSRLLPFQQRLVYHPLAKAVSKQVREKDAGNLAISPVSGVYTVPDVPPSGQGCQQTGSHSCRYWTSGLTGQWLRMGELSADFAVDTMRTVDVITPGLLWVLDRSLALQVLDRAMIGSRSEISSLRATLKNRIVDFNKWYNVEAAGRLEEDNASHSGHYYDTFAASYLSSGPRRHNT
ncbi:hypothetical protein EGW08_010964 [Elysia chlorotica]|uniref:Uncharacterized protein n=1 Tax=Elysia chlorotica TaxID=188477 RepID=A0A433TI78_ELYCH|nr:hypothetical protein EGW08_010964 [Elysia chlorotica]